MRETGPPLSSLGVLPFCSSRPDSRTCTMVNSPVNAVQFFFESFLLVRFLCTQYRWVWRFDTIGKTPTALGSGCLVSSSQIFCAGPLAISASEHALGECFFVLPPFPGTLQSPCPVWHNPGGRSGGGSTVTLSSPLRGQAPSAHHSRCPLVFYCSCSVQCSSEHAVVDPNGHQQ